MSNVFLEMVLPDQGPYCVVAINDKTKGIKRQTFVDSLQDIEQQAASIQASQHGTFIALAAYTTTDDRTAANARELRSFFLDLDVGTKKNAYKTQPEAAQALRIFLDATGLPDPLVVNSGGGVHAYWPLIESLPTAQWKPVAAALKALCITEGLVIDPAVTADAARVLRLPGTDNWKLDTPRPVQVMHLGAGPFALDDITRRLPAMAPSLDLSAARAYAAEAPPLPVISDLPKSKFANIVRLSLTGSGCGQMAHAIENAAELEEPLWRGALSIAWNCVDAEKSIHRLSRPHPDYTFENTVEKAQRTSGKPYTCAWYRQNYPEHCKGCAHRISSPIQLGAFVEEAAGDEEAYVVETSLKADNEDHNVTVEVAIPKYPFPYFRGEKGGVYRYEKDGEGNELPPTCIYPQDLYVTGRFYDSTEHGDGEGEIVGINLHLPHDGMRRFHCSLTALLTKDKMRDVLAKHGVIATNKDWDNIMAYLAASTRKFQGIQSSHRTRNQMGWTPEASFVVGELEYTTQGVKLAPAASGTKQLAPAFHAKGSLEEWSSVINFYNRVGMEAHAFGFLVGMGSPLLALLNSTQVRGGVLNLVSNGSGTGKTTVQMAINSIFGHPSELLMEAKDTPASRYQRLGTLNSICMTVDELTNASGEQISVLVYGSTSGRAPHRMEAQSNRLRANNTSWCSITVTSSNAVMSDALSTYRAAVEGELKRVIDLHITPPPADIPKAETDELFAKLASHYGVAGPIYAQHLVAHREQIAETLARVQAKADRDAGLERSDRFHSAQIAIAMTAGMLGNELGLFNFDLKRIYRYVLEAIAMTKATTTQVVGTAEDLALETLGGFINDNLNHTLVINRGTDGAPAAPLNKAAIQAPVRVRYEPDTRELVIPVAELREYFVARRVDFKTALAGFDAIGALVRSGTGLSTPRRVAAGAMLGLTSPAVRCYVFRAEVLGMDTIVEGAVESAPATGSSA